MKKQIVLLLILAVLCALFAGCSQLSSLMGSAQNMLGGDFDIDIEQLLPGMADNVVENILPEDALIPEQTAAAEEIPMSPVEMDEATVLEYVQIYNSCQNELYGAEVDYSVAYRRVYTSEESMMAGEDPVAVVDESDERYENCCDPTYSSLYPVTNFSAIEEIVENLGNYMTQEMISGFYLPFLEFEGRLYLVRGGMGTGSTLVGTDNMSVTDQTEDSFTLVADTLYFDEYAGNAYLYFVRQENRMLLAHVDLAY